MKIKDLPKHERPREKLIEKGTENLKDAELLAILLRTGRAGKSALDIAHHILSKHPKTKLLQLQYPDLLKINGLDTAKATTLLAAFELTKRALGVNETNLPLIQEPKDIVAQLTHLRNAKKEHFVALYLNARNQLLHKETISVGTLNASLVHPREVFEPAIRHNAAQLAIAHNHPSRNLDPSKNDIDITKKLVEAGKILGVEVIDHIIVSNTAHQSLKQKGVL
jgi:DNA repair protein RadC